jgi:hypothetical protein
MWRNEAQLRKPNWYNDLTFSTGREKFFSKFCGTSGLNSLNKDVICPNRPGTRVGQSDLGFWIADCGFEKTGRLS